jgi:DNA-binding NtrC family response regulator
MRLLIVGGLSGQLSAAAKIAMDRGARVAFSPDVDAALAALRKGQGADVLMVDVRQDIARLIRALEDERIAAPVVACGVKSDADAAVAAIKAGAKEFIPLPPDALLIAAVLEAVAEESSDLIAADPAMKKVIALADQVAASEASILITGESGVGKEVIAKYLHAKSRRAERPLISINCAAIPENLLESELFGHEKGAFTGATSLKKGLIEASVGGTLFLDEITEMTPAMQVKLLRVLQEREVLRLGATRPVKCDVRVIAATNRDVLKSVHDGAFREDLYFRLNVVNLDLPALAQRPGDIPLLARHFLLKYAQRMNKPVQHISADAMALLMAYRFPGNVRELENLIERGTAIAQGDSIGVAQLPDSLRAAETYPATRHEGRLPTLEEQEQRYIHRVLDEVKGNQTVAAQILGINRASLWRKLKAWKEKEG